MRTRWLTSFLTTILLVAACTGSGSPEPSAIPSDTATSPTPTAASSASPTASQSATPLPTASPAVPSSIPSPAAIPSPAPASLPVTADASDIATDVRLAPRPDGGLFVSVPATGGTVLASLDDEGAARAGWPLVLPGASDCRIDADPADGSVRAVCGVAEAAVRAYAFDPTGRLLAGWPIELRGAPADSWGGDATRLIDGDLYVALSVGEPAAPWEAAMLVRVSRDGSVEMGPRVEGMGSDAVIGPDGTVYLRSMVWREHAGHTTTISAFSLAGPRAGFPVSIDGMASPPVFAGLDRLYIATDDEEREEPDVSRSQVVALTSDGRVLAGWPVTVPIDTWAGSSDGGYGPAAPPVVGPDGSVYVVGREDWSGTVAFAFDPSGRRRAGWPFESAATLAVVENGSSCVCMCGPCSCDLYSTPPAAGPGGSLLIAQSISGMAGDRLVAVGADGEVEAGWPVYLAGEGAGFAGMAVGGDVVYGYAIEPARTGPNDCTVYSGTIVALDSTGSRLWATTLVLP